ncbi:MAG: gamma-glutamylcyclotransferase family protein [Acetobacterales bacterium]
MDYFFYGTLMDPALLARLVGAAAATVEPARLVGFRRVRLRGQPYPTVVPAEDGSVDGIVVGRIDAAGARRLAEYEGPSYSIRLFGVMLQDGRTRRVRVFVAPVGLASDGPWEP